MLVLSNEIRTNIINQLSIKQQEFLQLHVKRGKKTAFANAMAKDKGIVLPSNATSEELEILLEEWILDDYIDNGFINPLTTCECGRPLRYQYIVKHKTTNKIRRFGITHFEEHTGLSSSIVQEVKKGFSMIDYELDELLNKVLNDWSINSEVPHLPKGFKFPNDINEHLLNNIPLLDRQIKRIKKEVLAYIEGKQLEDRSTITKEIKSSRMIITDVMEQVDLFSFEDIKVSSTDNRENIKTEYNPSFLFDYENDILNYLKSGVSSARVICELLIRDFSLKSDRYSTGKPKLYIPLCYYLDSLVYEKLLEIKEIQDKEDRHYNLVVIH